MPRGNSLWKKMKFWGNQHRPMSEAEVSVRPRNEGKSPPSASRRKIQEILDVSDSGGHSRVIIEKITQATQDYDAEMF